ncbi:MAG: T9SS type A sorting domain-containing protein [Taibaiella sp.]|jgi:hypothetical protein
MIKTATLLAAILLSGIFHHAQAQTQFWSDNFEDAGAPSSGVRTPSVENSFGSPATRYFFRTAPAGIAIQNAPYSNVQGSKIWAAEDIDAALTGTNFGQSSNQNITWSGINISGKSGLSFKGLFAANNVGANWEGTTFGAEQDFMMIEYRIDNGTWNKIIRFYCNVALNGPLALDTDSNLVGDGTLLSAALTEFTANISGTGNVLDLRFSCFANGATTEELAIDNLRLFETVVPLPIDILSFEATQDHNNAVLNWRVPGSTTQHNFTVERSADGKTFYTLGDVQGHAGTNDGHGNIEYRFTDAKPLNKNNFYRIAQKGADGITTYSVIRLLQWGTAEPFVLFPNPAGDELNLVIHAVTAPFVQISIMDISGKVFIQETKALDDGMGKYRLSLATLPAGNYQVIIADQESILFRSRIVKK